MLPRLLRSSAAIPALPCVAWVRRTIPKLHVQRVGDTHQSVDRDVRAPLLDACVVGRLHAKMRSDAFLRLAEFESKLLNSQAELAKGLCADCGSVGGAL
jgi:hypothetical protein